jgi:hypothetical protein
MQTPWLEASSSIASGEFSRAAEVLGASGLRTHEACARLRAAEQLISAGRRPEGEAELARALAFYREVGATVYLRQAEALLAASA